MEVVYSWFANTLGQYISKEAVVFIVSLLPILECRGGLIVAAMLKVDIIKAIPLAVIGNLLPIPFILLFIKKIFKWLKNFNWSRGIVEKLENRALNKGDAMKSGEFFGLLFFVGIPLPGTGAWTGCLIAALLDMDKKKAFLYTVFGVLMAGIIMMILSFGILDNIIH